MSVYTHLTLPQVQDFAKDYSLNITQLTPIQGGVENTNYFLTADNGQQYVLTVFEELDADAAAELPPVLNHLGEKGVPVAVPLNHSDAYIHFIADKPAQIAPRIAGGHPIPSNLAQVSVMGKALAQLHLALKDYPLQRRNNHDQTWWDDTINELQPFMSTEDQTLLQRILTTFKAVKRNHPDRPQGLIHADLFRDNTLYVEDTLSGILDFSELTQGDFIVDISITLNDFCTDYPNAHLDKTKAQAFLKSYQSVRPLTQDELLSLNTYLAMAACRFWLSRLQMSKRNQTEGRTGQNILQKNPEEMRLILIDRLIQEYVW